jgi:anti-sigma regulatory factor (Ser/Thr protein kinase)
MDGSYLYLISEPSKVGEARRDAVKFAQESGFEETQVGKVAIVVTEAANNLVKHAQGGELIFRTFNQKSVSVMEILAIDSGPGMANVPECLQDGYSTTGTPGTGLGAIHRLSDFSDIYSQPGKGTVLFSQICGSQIKDFNSMSESDRFELGAICLPHPKEQICGDSWGHKIYEEQKLFLIVADGLGHGPKAAEASQTAVRLFQETNTASLAEFFETIHRGLSGTRGAAVTIVEVDATSRMVSAMAVGNVTGELILGDGTTKRFTAHNGTLGVQFSRLQKFEYPWPRNSLLLVNSDGLTTKCCEPTAYFGLNRRHPALIAGVFYRDFKRGNDDVTVVVVHEK